MRFLTDTPKYLPSALDPFYPHLRCYFRGVASATAFACNHLLLSCCVSLHHRASERVICIIPYFVTRLPLHPPPPLVIHPKTTTNFLPASSSSFFLLSAPSSIVLRCTKFPPKGGNEKYDCGELATSSLLWSLVLPFFRSLSIPDRARAAFAP